MADIAAPARFSPPAEAPLSSVRRRLYIAGFAPYRRAAFSFTVAPAAITVLHTERGIAATISRRHVRASRPQTVICAKCHSQQDLPDAEFLLQPKHL